MPLRPTFRARRTRVARLCATPTSWWCPPVRTRRRRARRWAKRAAARWSLRRKGPPCLWVALVWPRCPQATGPTRPGMEARPTRPGARAKLTRPRRSARLRELARPRGPAKRAGAIPARSRGLANRPCTWWRCAGRGWSARTASPSIAWTGFMPAPSAATSFRAASRMFHVEHCEEPACEESPRGGSVDGASAGEASANEAPLCEGLAGEALVDEISANGEVR